VDSKASRWRTVPPALGAFCEKDGVGNSPKLSRHWKWFFHAINQPAGIPFDSINTSSIGHFDKGAVRLDPHG